MWFVLLLTLYLLLPPAVLAVECLAHDGEGWEDEETKKATEGPHASKEHAKISAVQEESMTNPTYHP